MSGALANKVAVVTDARQGIRVNAICPGAMDTQMFQSLPAEFAQQAMSLQPIGRVGRPEATAQ